jgi:hypothetical protein
VESEVDVENLRSAADRAADVPRRITAATKRRFLLKKAVVIEES